MLSSSQIEKNKARSLFSEEKGEKLSKV